MKDKKNKIIAIISMLIMWQAISYTVNSPLILPSIQDTAREMGNIITNRDFPSLVLSSSLRAVTAFLISIISGIMLGFLASFIKIFESCLDIISGFFSSVPTVAIILLILIWFKSDTVTIIVAVLMVFPLIYKNVKYSIQNYDKDILNMLELYKVSFSKKIIKVFLPKVFIELNSIIPTAFLINFKMVIAGEVLSQPKNAIGTAISFEKAYLNTAGVFAYIAIILIISKILEVAIKKITTSLQKIRYKNVQDKKYKQKLQ